MTPGAAAIQYNGSAGGGRVVYLGFPFESISSANRRTGYMANILTYFTTEADAADPDLDRLPNRIEYATGSDPLTRDFTPPVTVAAVSSTFAAQLNRNLSAIAIISTVEVATELRGAWTSIAQSTAGAAYTGLATGCSVQEIAGNFKSPVTLTRTAPLPDPPWHGNSSGSG